MNTNEITIRATHFQAGITMGGPVQTVEGIEVLVHKFGRPDRWIPWDLFVSISESHNSHIGEIRTVRYREPSGCQVETYGKIWSSWDADSVTWRIQRLGTGAYGDGVIWKRPISRN